ncbi:unnamed protein product [Camellia sinensis]
MVYKMSRNRSIWVVTTATHYNHYSGVIENIVVKIGILCGIIGRDSWIKSQNRIDDRKILLLM